VIRLPVSYPLSAAVALAVLTPVAVLALLAFGAEAPFHGRSWQLAGNTVAVTLLTVAGAVLVGVPLALLTTHADLPGRRLWLALLAAPLAVPSYVGAFAFFAASGPGGELEAVTGLAIPAVSGLWGTALVMILYTYPFILLTTRASLRQLDGQLVDAGRSLGLSLPAALWRVVLPRARAGIAAGALLVALYALSDFATPSILRFDTFTRAIYVEYNAFGLDRAALLSLQLLGLVAIVLWLEARVGTEREAPGRPFHFVLPHGLRLGAVAAMALLLLAAVGVPGAVLGLWFLRDGGGSFDPMLVWNSAYPSLLAALLAVTLALPVAFAASGGRFGRLLERVATLGFGIPGIVLGTALVYVGLRVEMLYQTLALLVCGYALRFLPLAVGAIRTSVARLEGNLSSAARLLGASPLEAFRRISLPLILPGMSAGGALVFLEAMRELPATLLLAPTGLETLTTELWRVYEAGYFGRAAVPGLLLIAVSAVALVLMLAGEDRARTGG
jgi:iron(III) transport system permease protein